MLNERKFNIVIVNNGIGAGTAVVEKYNKVIVYNGKKILVNL